MNSCTCDFSEPALVYFLFLLKQKPSEPRASASVRRAAPPAVWRGTGELFSPSLRASAAVMWLLGEFWAKVFLTSTSLLSDSKRSWATSASPCDTSPPLAS